MLYPVEFKQVCDKIEFNYSDKYSYSYEGGFFRKMDGSEADVREIVFRPVFIDKYIKYLFSEMPKGKECKSEEELKKVIWFEILDNLEAPLEIYLHNYVGN